MNRSPTVMVAGAGVLGLTCALALADAGCRVTVCDPGGANASSVAAGMIAPVFEAVLDPSARGHFDLLMAARDLWPGLARRAGLYLDRTGAMAVGEDDWLEGLAAKFSALGLRANEIEATTARSLAPGLSEVWPRALLTREDWRVDAPSALESLRHEAEAAGVAFRPWRVSGKGNADVLLVASGAACDLREVAPELDQLSPIKGHIVRVAAPSTGAVVRGEGVYASPGLGMAFGASMEPGRSDDVIDPAVVQTLLAAGLTLFPGLSGQPVEASTGVRAATVDGLPLVGWSQEPGVMLAAGARRNGWLLAPMVARMAVAYVLGQDVGDYAELFDPRRRQTEGRA